MRDYPILHLDTNVNEHERVSNIKLRHKWNEHMRLSNITLRHKCKWTYETIQYNS
jgi:hypothetical protein